MNDLEKTLSAKLQRYKTAVAMAKGKIPTDNSFRWPFFPGFSPKDPKNVLYWNGCIAELEAVMEEIKGYSFSSAKAKASCSLPLTEKSQGIHVNGHMGVWRVIRTTTEAGKKLFVLEHERYGELSNHLLVDENANIIRVMEGEYDSYMDDEDDYY